MTPAPQPDAPPTSTPHASDIRETPAQIYFTELYYPVVKKCIDEETIGYYIVPDVTTQHVLYLRVLSENRNRNKTLYSTGVDLIDRLHSK